MTRAQLNACTLISNFYMLGYVGLAPDIRRYIDEKYDQILQRVSKQNPRQYEPVKFSPGARLDANESMLRLIPMVNEQTIQKPSFEMRLEKTVCQLVWNFTCLKTHAPP